MKIQGAVLEEIGRTRPYQDSRPITVSELDLDEPGPGEVLVRIEAAGICHSDLSVVNGSRVRPVPMLLGHEASGRVEKLGAGVDDLTLGARVVMTFLPRCGACAGCQTGGRLPCSVGSASNNTGVLMNGGIRLHRDGHPILHHLGVSGFATHAVIDRHSIVPIEDDIPADIAAVLGCAVLTGGGAVMNAGRPEHGDSIAIVGLGGVGMAALITAVSLAKGTVIGIDAVPAKLAKAKELGVTAVYSPQEALDAGIKASIVVEAAGNVHAVETAVAVTAPGGRTVTVGLPAPDARSSISPLGLVAEARSIVGSYLGSAVPSRDIPTYAQLWRDGLLPVDELISRRVGLDEINEAMDELSDGKAIRQVIMFD